VVIGIPEDDRCKYRQRDDAAEIWPGRNQPAPQFRHGHQPDQNRRAEKQRSVFRQQRRADRGADREPPGAASGLQYLGEKEQDKAGGHQQRRVRRDDHGADRRHQCRIEQQRGGRSQAMAAEQDRSGAIDRPAHRQRQQDRHQPHAEFGVAGDHGAQPDHERDAGRMIVIAAGEMLRPHPVIGFVEGDRGRGRGHQPQRHQRQYRQNRAADEPHIVRAHCSFIACARRTVRTSRNSRPRPSARRQHRPATRSAPDRKLKMPRRHWRRARRRKPDKTTISPSGWQSP
jgi:hypothetical protein